MNDDIRLAEMQAILEDCESEIAYLKSPLSLMTLSPETVSSSTRSLETVSSSTRSLETVSSDAVFLVEQGVRDTIFDDIYDYYELTIFLLARDGELEMGRYYNIGMDEHKLAACVANAVANTIYDKTIDERKENPDGIRQKVVSIVFPDGGRPCENLEYAINCFIDGMPYDK
jgi:hypothetical protein